MQWQTRSDSRIVLVQLGPKIEPLLLIRLTTCQLVTQWKVAPPGAAAALHSNRKLVLETHCEKLLTHLLELLDQLQVHVVADNIEKPPFTTRDPDLVSKVTDRVGSRQKRRDVQDRDRWIERHEELTRSDRSHRRALASTARADRDEGN